MIYEIVDEKLKAPSNLPLKQNAIYCASLTSTEAEDVLSIFKIPPKLFHHVLENKATRFEAHEYIDIFCVPAMDMASFTLTKTNVIYFFLTHSSLLIVCDTKMIDDLLHHSLNDPVFSCGEFLHSFFENMTHKDTHYLDKMEREINKLEDEVLLHHPRKDLIGTIIENRKRISVLKHYYEQLLDIFDLLEENKNNLLSETALRSFQILDSRINRLYQDVVRLGDYISQIREAYQSEVDITLNQTMKFFTVITAIFFPLTLIVGWYGMNLKMPEYNWAFSYPLVIGLSIAIVAACYLYFKKHNWF